MFHCKICEQYFEELPEGALELGRSHNGYQIHLFPGGAVHDLTEIETGKISVPAIKVAEPEVETEPESDSQEIESAQPLVVEEVESETEPESEEILEDEEVFEPSPDDWYVAYVLRFNEFYLLANSRIRLMTTNVEFTFIV